MGLQTHIVKNTFKKIFKNLSEKRGVLKEDIVIGIEYRNGNTTYVGYEIVMYENVRCMKKITETIPLGEGQTQEVDLQLNLSDYIGVAIDMTGGTEMINISIAEHGKGYAKKLDCDVDKIDILLAYNGEDNLPKAKLRKGKVFVQDIDIATEILGE